MSNFSLTNPEPQLRRRAANDGRDYGALALDHWLTAQLVNHDLEERWNEGVEVGKRLVAGDQWFRVNGDDHPKANVARRQHNKLLNEQQRLLFEVKCLYVKLWLEVCAVHGALNSHDDPDTWITENAPQVEANDPIEFWKALQPERKPPYTNYPPVEAYYIERGFETQEALDAWMHRSVEKPHSYAENEV